MCFSDWYLAIVPILIGAGMLSFWALAIATRRVPEIEAGGIEIWFRIVAETVTGVVLIAGGVAVLSDGIPSSRSFSLLSAWGCSPTRSSCPPATTLSAETCL